MAILGGHIYTVSKEGAQDFDLEEYMNYVDNGGFANARSIETFTKDRWSGINRLEEIERLARELEGIAEFDGIKFRIVDRDKYFESLYRRFHEQVSELQNVSFNQFSGSEACCDLEAALSRLKDAAEGDGEYVYNEVELGGVITFADFMRQLNNGDGFYVGSIFYYTN